MSDFFLDAHLKKNPDSQAHLAYFFFRDGLKLPAIARRLKVPAAEVPDLVALGQRLVPARRR